MRRRILLASIAYLFCGPMAYGATTPIVRWSVRAAPAQVKADAKFKVSISGQIDPGWHLYALEEPDGGPVATEVALTEGDPADLLRVEEGKPKILPDAIFRKPTGFFEGSADFTLYLKAARVASADAGGLRILIRYQSCNDRICMPPRTDTVLVPLAFKR